MKRSMSLTARLALLFAVSSSIILLGLGWVIGVEIERHFQSLDAETLRGKLVLVQHLVQGAATGKDLRALPRRIDDAFVGHHGLALQVNAADGSVLLVSGDQSVFPPRLLASPPAIDAAGLFTWGHGDRVFRGMSASIPTAVPGFGPLSVAVAMDVAEHQAFMASFKQTLWSFIAAAALATGFLGWLTARRGLAPLSEMRKRAASVTAQSLRQRLPAEAVPKELADLAASLNDMFERLEDAFARLSHFSSDIAHELRTPVSNLMTQTQVCLSRPRDAAHYRAILESNEEEFERLSHMISQMLYLAKAENGLLIPNSEPLDLGQLVQDMFDFYDALADERKIRLLLQGEAQVTGDKLMLRRALGNLLSNAIRHAADGSPITVRIAATATDVELSVENYGETIPARHLSNIFNRFYRADPARQHETAEGAGLGLAITKAIMAAHRGDVSASSTAGVTRVAMRIPRAM